MEIDYYVQNKKTREVLNRRGGWSEDFGSYRLAIFASEAAAQAAFPSGVECLAVAKKRREDKHAQGFHFALLHSNKFWDKNGEFKSPAAISPQTFLFATKDEALDKAEELGLDLGLVEIKAIADKA